MSQDPLRTAFGRAHRELLLSGDVRGVSDSLAVWRPTRMVLVGIRGLCQIAGVAMLRGKREQLAASRKGDAIAIGRHVVIRMLRHIGIADVRLRIYVARAGPRAVVRHEDIQIVYLLGREVE